MPRRRRRVGRLELFYVTVLIGLLVGGSLWLDRNGVPVTGRVTAKQERILVGHEPSGDWDRYHEVGAAFEAPGSGPSQATVRVSPERYETLRIGDPIELRYLPQFPLLARTTDRSTASVARELAWGLVGIPILLWLAGGFLALWIAARMGTIPVLAAGVTWLAAAYPLLFSPPSREGSRPAEALAEVRGLTLVNKSPSRLSRTRRHTSRFNRRLEVPYHVVELAVPVPGGRDTVLAVDAVDSGSVRGLAHGALLPVRLDPAAPREAQLAGGTRRFVEANRYHFLVPVVGCGILGTLAALLYRGRRRKREATAGAGSIPRPGTAIATGALLLLLGAGSAAAGDRHTGDGDSRSTPAWRYEKMHHTLRSTSPTRILDRAADAADSLEGPWDEVAIGVEGQLAVLAGERMLELAYLTSSTDLTGAIRLSHPALRGLAAAR
jgi:hypothetical protein